MNKSAEADPFGGDDNPFDSPASFGAKLPSLGQFKNRLLIIEWKAKSTQPDRYNPGKFQTRHEADVTVLDGEPFTYRQGGQGTDPEDRVEFDTPIQVPVTLKRFYISNVVLGQQIDGKRLVAGRLVRLPKIGDNVAAWAVTDVPGLAKAVPAALTEQAKRYPVKSAADAAKQEKAMVAEREQAAKDFITARNFINSRDVFGG